MGEESILSRSKEFLVFTMGGGNRGIPMLGLSITERCLKLSS